MWNFCCKRWSEIFLPIWWDFKKDGAWSVLQWAVEEEEEECWNNSTTARLTELFICNTKALSLDYKLLIYDAHWRPHWEYSCWKRWRTHSFNTAECCWMCVGYLWGPRRALQQPFLHIQPQLLFGNFWDWLRALKLNHVVHPLRRVGRKTLPLSYKDVSCGSGFSPTHGV